MRGAFASVLLLLSAACVHSRLTYISPVADDGASSASARETEKISTNESDCKESISVRIPIIAKKLFSSQNEQSTEHPAGTTLEYFVGMTTSTTNTKSITDRVENQYNAYAEVSAKYGFSEISNVSAKVRFSNTNTGTKETRSINETGSTITQNKKLTLKLGAIPPGEAKYVYQLAAQLPSAIMDFNDLIISEEPIQLDSDSAVILEGPGIRTGLRHKFGIVSLHDTNKCLAYYHGASHLYLGGAWVLNAPAADGCEWYAERRNDVKGTHAYWIVHKQTGKLLSWYQGARDVFVADPWMLKVPFLVNLGVSALWKIEPSGEISGAFYFEHFKTGRVLSWYKGRGDKPYAGDPWVKKAPSKYKAALWKMVAQDEVIELRPGGTFSKQGNRRTCAWDRCPSSGFYWNKQLGEGCSCKNGLNTCYLDGEPVTVAEFEQAKLIPINSCKYKFEAVDENAHALPIGYGKDTASGKTCFDDPLRGGFSIDLTGTGFVFAEGSKVTLNGWGAKMRLSLDGNEVFNFGVTGTETRDVPAGGTLLEVNCGGWGGNCKSDIFVTARPRNHITESKKYAPIYYFDGSSSKYCLPDWPSSRNDNNCKTSFLDSTPSFVQYNTCGSYEVYTYWLWYGDQKGCIAFDEGHGDDWEHVSVFVRNGQVKKVIFHQHKGHYTRRRGTFDMSGERPHVYVGKVGHGSYHTGCNGKCSAKEFFTQGCLGSVNYCQGGCGYWDDFRNPGPKLSSYRLHDLRKGVTVDGIKRPDRDICVSSCEGSGSRLIGTSGCWKNKP